MKRLIYITVSDFTFNKGKMVKGQHLYVKGSSGHMITHGIHTYEDKKKGIFYMQRYPNGRSERIEYDELDVYVPILVHVNVKNIQKTDSRL